MRAVAIVAQNAAHGPTVDIPLDAILPGIDTVVGAGNAVEARGVEQDVEFVFLPRGFDALRCDALDRLIHGGIDQRHVSAVVSFEIAVFQGHPARAEAVIFGNQLVRHFWILHALAKGFDPKRLFLCISYRHKSGMKYGYARVSTDGQSVDAQGRQLTKAAST